MKIAGLRNGHPMYNATLGVLLGLALACVTPENGGDPVHENDSNDERAPSGDVIEISTAEELERIGNHEDYPLSGNYLLVSDIDLSQVDEFEPIGFYSTSQGEAERFDGTFDGGGHTISGLTIQRAVDDSEEIGVGLFAAHAGEIYDLVVENFTIAGHVGVGPVAGHCSGLVEDVTVINPTIEAFTSGGGVVGMGSCDLRRVYATGGTVHAAGQVGGIIGSTMTGGIWDSKADVQVLGGGHDLEPAPGGADATSMGGLVGSVNGNFVISRSEAYGDVSAQQGGDVWRVGGLAGNLKGSSSAGAEVVDSAAHGDIVIHGVTDNSSLTSIGGLIGEIQTNVEVHRSFSRGEVHYTASPDNSIGGFVGTVDEGTIVSASVYDKDTVGSADLQDSAVGAHDGLEDFDVEPKTTAAMHSQDTYTERQWDFASIWAIDDTTAGGYPYIQALHH